MEINGELLTVNGKLLIIIRYRNQFASFSRLCHLLLLFDNYYWMSSCLLKSSAVISYFSTHFICYVLETTILIF